MTEKKPTKQELIDNIDYTVVPAPSALALVGIAGMIGVRRRR
jgi:xanthosine utilization system XapX-like protein